MLKVCQNRWNFDNIIVLGEVAEWSNVPDSKSGVPQGTAGSNPALSANCHDYQPE